MIGPPSKVLPKVASEISSVPSGELTLRWTTAHGHRVLEVSPTTVHLAATPISEEQPAKADQDAADDADESGRHPMTWGSVGAYWGRACVAAFRTVFPKGGAPQ